MSQTILYAVLMALSLICFALHLVLVGRYKQRARHLERAQSAYADLCSRHIELRTDRDTLHQCVGKLEFRLNDSDARLGAARKRNWALYEENARLRQVVRSSMAIGGDGLPIPAGPAKAEIHSDAACTFNYCPTPERCKAGKCASPLGA